MCKIELQHEQKEGHLQKLSLFKIEKRGNHPYYYSEKRVPL